jgi:protein-S-isoprenylcysteine O-methyltransferase Ste14
MSGQPSSGWAQIARRIRVPLGFVTAAVFLAEVARLPPHPDAIGWSLVLVSPGVALRALASGTVQKNRELTVTGPYAYTRNPLYLGSSMIAAGFALALLSWTVAVLLALGSIFIYVPVIASEERFLRAKFPEFDVYRRSVPRFLPRLTPARLHGAISEAGVSQAVTSERGGGFSLELYLQHREYNAAIGAALLYLSLLYLQPVVQSIVHRAG